MQHAERRVLHFSGGHRTSPNKFVYVLVGWTQSDGGLTMKWREVPKFTLLVTACHVECILRIYTRNVRGSSGGRVPVVSWTGEAYILL